MCGIIGFQGNFNKQNFSKALKKIHHRGPDNSSTYIDETNKVYLGHTRLAIQDTSPNGNQPMISNDKNYVIIFNGEIYNFKLLKDTHFKKDIKFNSKTDTEVILNLYIKYGEDFISMLNGIFTICIYNKLNQSFYIYRDGFGVKPLYFIHDRDGLAFSSEIKAIIEIIDSKQLKEINNESIYYYLKYNLNQGHLQYLMLMYHLQVDQF